MTKTCKACESWESRKGTEEYERCLSNHECDLYYEGSSGLCKQQVLLNALCLLKMIGNFDTSII